MLIVVANKMLDCFYVVALFFREGKGFSDQSATALA